MIDKLIDFVADFDMIEYFIGLVTGFVAALVIERNYEKEQLWAREAGDSKGDEGRDERIERDPDGLPDPVVAAVKRIAAGKGYAKDHRLDRFSVFVSNDGRVEKFCVVKLRDGARLGAGDVEWLVRALRSEEKSGLKPCHAPDSRRAEAGPSSGLEPRGELK